MEQHLSSDESPLSPETPALTDRRTAIAHHMAALEELADPASRPDGWTPFARKLFLQILAETGRVTAACDCAGLSKQSAYALRARDPIFAAGWDAACELARIPLADALFEQALDGLTETITRDDGRTMTRHRFDSRLSIAVLNRLDRRCDRAAELVSRHVGAVGQWDEFTAAVGRDDEQAAEAILASAETPVPSGVEGAKLSQPSQLRLDPDDEEVAANERIWWDEEREDWRTDFPPPEGFDGDEQGGAGGYYSRSLTSDELDLVKRDCAAADQEDRAADEAARDSFFAVLRAEFAIEDHPPIRHPGLDPGSAFPANQESQADPGSGAGVTGLMTPPA